MCNYVHVVKDHIIYCNGKIFYDDTGGMYSKYGIMFIKEYSLVLMYNCTVLSSVVISFLVTNLHSIMYLYMQKI